MLWSLLPPISQTDEYIKRVIALPGETVTVSSGRGLCGLGPAPRELFDETIYTNEGSFLSEGEGYLVPNGEYIVMGDNREHSSDSRSWGPITKKEISGRAWVIYWPPSLAGTVEKPSYSY